MFPIGSIPNLSFRFILQIRFLSILGEIPKISFSQTIDGTKVKDYLIISHQARGTCRYPTLSPTLRLNICSGYHRTSLLSSGSRK